MTKSDHVLRISNFHINICRNLTTISKTGIENLHEVYILYEKVCKEINHNQQLFPGSSPRVKKSSNSRVVGIKPEPVSNHSHYCLTVPVARELKISDSICIR